MTVIDVNSFLFATHPGGPFTAPGGGGTGGDGVVGVGSPEGVVTAEPGTTYFDTSGDIFWVKESGSAAVGWFQLVG